MELSTIELEALAEIERWEARELSWLRRLGRLLGAPAEKLSVLVLKIPGLGEVLEKISRGMVELVNEGAQRTVRPEAIFEEYRKLGAHGVHGLADVARLELAVVDRAIGALKAKYLGLAAGEGALAGSLGLPGLAADIPSLVGLNLRAIGEYATYYGFDLGQQGERKFALEVLALASSPQGAKRAVLSQLNQTAAKLAGRATWKQLEEQAVVRALRELARTIGYRLTKAKLAQGLPVVGAVVAAGFNTDLTAQVCDAAWHLYRKRFLERKRAL